MFGFSNYLTKSKYYDNSNKLVAGKMKDEPAGAAIQELAWYKPKMHLYLIDENSQHKKEKGLNKKVVSRISHSEYKDVLLDKKCVRH